MLQTQRQQHEPVWSEHVALLWVEDPVPRSGSLRPRSSLHMKVLRPARVQSWAVKNGETVTLWAS